METILSMAALFVLGLVLGRMSAVDQLRHAAHIRDMIARYDRSFGIAVAKRWQDARRLRAARKVEWDQWLALFALAWSKLAVMNPARVRYTAMFGGGR